MRLGVHAAVVDGEIVDGDIEVVDGRVATVGAQPSGRRGLAAPGFVDLQVNGFAGVDFHDADTDGFRAAGAALARTGVTSYLATLISSPLATYERVLALGEALDRPAAAGTAQFAGFHLEGPFIARRWAGAHDPDHVRDPDLRLASELTRRGRVRMMTLAPERPGGLALVEQLVAGGTVVSLGHADADAATAHAAFDRGAAALTHVYNAQRRWSSRDPGLAGVALVRPDVTVTMIVDHVHLAPETARLASVAAAGRLALITDAIAAAGAGDGAYGFAHRPVTVSGGEARLPDGTLAGSLLTMDQALRNLVGVGVDLPAAVAAATSTPARLLGDDQLGRLAPGAPADLVVLDDELAVVRTLVAGQEAG